MISKYMLIRWLTIAGVALLLAGSELGAEQKPDGAELFRGQACVMCHGPDGKGFAAIHTPDFTDPKWQASQTDKQIEDTIKNGKPNTAMKPFGDKLKENEIDALVKYIRSLNSKPTGKKK